MESVVSLFSIGTGVISFSLWVFFFSKIRNNMAEDGESRKRTALKALILLFIAVSLSLSGRSIPRIEPYPFADFLIFCGFIAVWAGLGMVINYNVLTHNQAITPFQHKINLFTSVVMIASIVWAIIPYVGFVFFPNLGLPLDISVSVTAIILAVIAGIDIVTN